MVTQPTQAQIEAAATVLMKLDCQCLDWQSLAKAALTAAAEVGPGLSEIGKLKREINNPYADWIEARKHEVELAKLATIERCAQVAEWKGYATVGRQIAAAIREIKDKP